MDKKIVIASSQQGTIKTAEKFIDRIKGKGFFFDSGEGVLEEIQRLKPALIVLEKNLPGVSGDEICYLLKNDLELRTIPVLILIASDRAETLERCLLCGCDDYLLVPAREHDLTAKMASLLRLPHRKEMRILVKTWLKGKKFSKYFFGSLKDLSLSGMLFSSDVELDPDETLEITFFLPATTRKISVVCKVVRLEQSALEDSAEKYLFGVQFLNMEEQDHKYLKDYLDKLNQ